MPSRDPERRRAASRVAATHRHHPHDPALPELRRDLRFATLAEHITNLVDQAPPLTAEQRDRLALLLKGGGTA